jgi:predicted RNA-binding Zn ribbon-like protein
MTQNRPPPMFIADSVGIDFLNSIATPVDVPVEWLSTGQDFLDWIEHAGIVPSDTLNRVRRAAAPGELEATAGQARALREWFRGFVREHMGRPLRTDVLQELAPLNRLLERDEEYSQISTREPVAKSTKHLPLELRSLRRWRSASTLMIPIALAMADLICNEDFLYVKACEGPTCTLLFLDKTHGHARRWCSMTACGNRAKQAAYRDRVRKTEKH